MASDHFNDLQREMFGQVLANIVDFCRKKSRTSSMGLDCAALMTGVNLPDHDALFKLLRHDLKREVTPHVASIVSSNVVLTQRGLIQSVVGQLIEMSADEGEEDDYEEVKTSNKTLPYLQSIR